MTRQSSPPAPARLPVVRLGLPTVASVAELGLAALLWLDALAAVDPYAMTDTGLISVLPWTGFAALAVVAVGFARVVSRTAAPRWLLTAYPVTLCAFLYATPPILYGVPRYSWAWKHAGIIDYIQRTGTVDRQIDVLQVYHNWPGFFAFNAMLTELAGVESSMSYAAWAELFLNLLTVAAAIALLRALTDDPRTVAVGGWLFVLGNWVGQGYFSPQGINYVWYLLMLAILLRGFAHAPPEGREESSPSQRVGLMAVLLLFVFCIVSTHQLTPVITVLMLGALVVFRRTTARALPVFAAALVGGWVLYVAAPFAQTSLPEALGAIGAVDENLEDTLIGYDLVSEGQQLVSLMARGLTLTVCLLAGLGALEALRRRRRDYTALILAGVPTTLVALSPYGSEILFRAYMFALPGLVFFAAILLWPPGATAVRVRAVLLVLVSGVLMVGFLFAQYGNDRSYHFSRAEVAAASFVYEVAPPNSLLVEGSRNYPSQFENYDNFVYVPIARESQEDRQKIIDHPRRLMARWLGDQTYAGSYLILTRSQEAAVESLGEMPRGGLDRIESRLLSSDAFRVIYRNDDAVVFVRADRPVNPRTTTLPGPPR